MIKKQPSITKNSNTIPKSKPKPSIKTILDSPNPSINPYLKPIKENTDPSQNKK